MFRLRRIGITNRYRCLGSPSVVVALVLMPSGTVVYTGPPWKDELILDVPEGQTLNVVTS